MSIKEINNQFRLFWIGFIQLIFLSGNVYAISSVNYPMIIITGLGTNLFFSYAVTKLAFSGWVNRLIYSLGCTGGCVVGTWIAVYIRNSMG